MFDVEYRNGMLNPYTILTPALLQAMLKQPMYFVRQHYPRGGECAELPTKGTEETQRQQPQKLFVPSPCPLWEMQSKNPPTTPILLTHYVHHDTDKERAERHMRLLMKDRYRFLYDSTIPLHRAKLEKAAEQPDGYRVYINLLPKKCKPSEAMKRKIAHYMAVSLPAWKYSPADQLKVTLKERYGELFLALLWKGQQCEVHLDLVENPGLCATT